MDNMMKITICDDSLQEIETLTELCRRFAEENAVEVEIRGLSDPHLLFEGEPPDVLLLDIEMPKMSGIAVKDSYFGQEKPLIVFVSSHGEMMPEAYGANVIGFLMKPVQWEYFEKRMHSAYKLLHRDFPIEFEDGNVVSSRDLVMIRAEGKLTEAVFADGTKKQWLRRSLQSWEDMLGQQGFIRISKSCLLNCRHIKVFEGSVIKLKNGETAEPSRRRKAECFEKFKDYCRKYNRYV